MPLHLTKVAFGCASADVLAARLIGRATDGASFVDTRYRPRRAGEIDGGSLFWIIKHRLVARSPILGFDESDDGKRCIIRIDEGLIPVRALPRRAHQGWRYLDGGAAPADLFDGADEEDMAALPRHIADELAALALL